MLSRYVTYNSSVWLKQKSRRAGNFDATLRNGVEKFGLLTFCALSVFMFPRDREKNFIQTIQN